MIVFSNKHRSTQMEIMDDVGFKGQEMKMLLDDLKKVNRLLGGNSITIAGIEKLMLDHPKKKTIKILDVGCGDGELLRKCAKFGITNNFHFKLVGIDFNENILQAAKKKSNKFPQIKFQKVDVLLEKDLIPNCDIALCTLFLHHFSNEKITSLLNILLKKSNIGLVVNDLHRSKQAFNLFKIFSKLLLNTKTAEHDGLVSIAKGFKKEELEMIATHIPNQQSSIQWRWAFRYQWVLKKTI